MLKPTYLYHGSITPNIDTLMPRKRYIPDNEKNTPECIYATDDPGFAAAHAFPWSSNEGIDLYYDEDEAKVARVHLEVPAKLFARLNQPVYIYKVNSSSFYWIKEDVLGKTYRSLERVKCLGCQRFSTVLEAIQTFGGKVHEKKVYL